MACSMGRSVGQGAAALFACALGLTTAFAARAADPHAIIGVWIPDQRDQGQQIAGNPAPWQPQILAQVQHLQAEERAGRPFLVLKGCLPHGMPTLMLITHNAFELLETPGRVTLLGEGEGNELRRIYTDGRKHPDDPDPGLFGHSIGHWEGETLVVDTVGISPEAFIAVSEAVGIPNNGDMHIVERIHLAGPKTLHDDLTITAPKVFTRPWQTTRVYGRTDFDIAEGECVVGNFKSGKDSNGNSVFISRERRDDGTLKAGQ